MRDGSSIAATKASAVNCPTPGMVIMLALEERDKACRTRSAGPSGSRIIAWDCTRAAWLAAPAAKPLFELVTAR
jgi:hypothetical protein